MTLKFLLEFPEAVFLEVLMESPLDEEEVLSRKTRIITQEGQNFWYDRWIALKCLQEFPEAIFHGEPIESLLANEKVLSLETRISA